MNEYRRAKRRKVPQMITVRDVMLEQTVGRLGNLSESGMLMLSTVPLRDDALYQLRFALADRRGRRQEIEVGVHQLWSDAANVEGHFWCGFRFIDIGADALGFLRDWIEEPEGEHV